MNTVPDHRYILIPAGGVGTRLWPLSRSTNPKQFAKLLPNGQSLFQHSVELATELVGADHVVIIAATHYHHWVHEQAPELAKENILPEPERRDNGPAIMLGIASIVERDPDAVVGIIWCDHLVEDKEAYKAAFDLAFTVSADHPNRMVRMGTRPLFPDPGFGYIQKAIGQTLAYDNQHASAYPAPSYHEKPPYDTAKAYGESGDYLWNTGYKFVHGKTFLESMYATKPDLQDSLLTCVDAIVTSDADRLAQNYSKLPKDSIEYLYTEGVEGQLVVEGRHNWTDIGNWAMMHQMAKRMGDGHHTQSLQAGEHVTINAENILIHGTKKLVGVVGVSNVSIIETDDAIVVVSHDHVQDVKQLQKEVKEKFPGMV